MLSHIFWPERLQLQNEDKVKRYWRCSFPSPPVPHKSMASYSAISTEMQSSSIASRILEAPLHRNASQFRYNSHKGQQSWLELYAPVAIFLKTNPWVVLDWRPMPLSIGYKTSFINLDYRVFTFMVNQFFFILIQPFSVKDTFRVKLDLLVHQTLYVWTAIIFADRECGRWLQVFERVFFRWWPRRW